MARLFFGSFVNIMCETVCRNMDKKDVIGWLIGLPIQADEWAYSTLVNEPTYLVLDKYSLDIKYNSFITTYCEYSVKNKMVPLKFRRYFSDKKRKPAMIKELTKLLNASSDFEVYALQFKLKQLIEWDAQIDPATKSDIFFTLLEEDLRNNNNASVADFLYLVLIEAVMVDVKKEIQSFSCCTNLPPENNYYVGHKEELEQIKNNFKGNQLIQTIYGAGGVGKTQLALRYAREYLRAYDIVWFINTESEADISRSITEFLIEKRIDAPFSDSEKRLVFRNYFTTATCSWLLIFDNSNYEIETDRQILEECLPTTGKGKILITTQTAIPFESTPQVQVNVFSKEDALDFLWKRTGIQPDECAEKIIEAYDRHPLALEYAGAYISQPGGSYEKYLQVLTEKGTISISQELLRASCGSRVSVRTGRMAGANRDLLSSGRLGNRPSAARYCGRSNGALSAMEAQEGHQILRREDQ